MLAWYDITLMHTANAQLEKDAAATDAWLMH